MSRLVLAYMSSGIAGFNAGSDVGFARARRSSQDDHETCLHNPFAQFRISEEGEVNKLMP